MRNCCGESMGFGTACTSTKRDPRRSSSPRSIASPYPRRFTLSHNRGSIINTYGRQRGTSDGYKKNPPLDHSRFGDIFGG